MGENDLENVLFALYWTEVSYSLSNSYSCSNPIFAGHFSAFCSIHYQWLLCHCWMQPQSWPELHCDALQRCTFFVTLSYYYLSNSAHCAPILAQFASRRHTSAFKRVFVAAGKVGWTNSISGQSVVVTHYNTGDYTPMPNTVYVMSHFSWSTCQPPLLESYTKPVRSYIGNHMLNA